MNINTVSYILNQQDKPHLQFQKRYVNLCECSLSYLNWGGESLQLLNVTF